MQKRSVCASQVLGASREDRRVKKESMLGLELSLMKYYEYKVLYQADGGVKKKSDIGDEAKLVHHCLVLASILFMQ